MLLLRKGKPGQTVPAHFWEFATILLASANSFVLRLQYGVQRCIFILCILEQAVVEQWEAGNREGMRIPFLPSSVHGHVQYLEVPELHIITYLAFPTGD